MTVIADCGSCTWEIRTPLGDLISQEKTEVKKSTADFSRCWKFSWRLPLSSQLQTQVCHNDLESKVTLLPRIISMFYRSGSGCRAHHSLASVTSESPPLGKPYLTAAHDSCWLIFFCWKSLKKKNPLNVISNPHAMCLKSIMSLVVCFLKKLGAEPAWHGGMG